MTKHEAPVTQMYDAHYRAYLDALPDDELYELYLRVCGGKLDQIDRRAA